jgi:Leucine-rich repeat (LRR) protein
LTNIAPFSLKNLYLKKNEIIEVENGSFDNLSVLNLLDLSNNQIKLDFFKQKFNRNR